MRKNAHFLTLVWLLLIAAVFPAALWSRPADSPAASQDVSTQQYAAELRAASAVLDGRNPAAIHEFRLVLPSEWVVQADGQPIRVKTDWLASALLIEENDPKADSVPLQRARQHLAALQQSAEELSGQAANGEWGNSRGQIEHILSGREFQGSHGPSALDELKARVNSWISRHLQGLSRRLGISTAIGDTIAWTLISLVALLLVFWTVRSLIARASREEMDLRGAAPAGQDWRYWVAEARAQAQRGDYRAAIHAAYWAAVARLEENHQLPEDRSRTPRESLRLVQRGSEAYAPFAYLTGRLELTWYGYRAATSADWNDTMEQLETLGCLRSSTPATAGS